MNYLEKGFQISEESKSTIKTSYRAFKDFECYGLEPEKAKDLTNKIEAAVKGIRESLRDKLQEGGYNLETQR